MNASPYGSPAPQPGPQHSPYPQVPSPYHAQPPVAQRPVTPYTPPPEPFQNQQPTPFQGQQPAPFQAQQPQPFQGQQPTPFQSQQPQPFQGQQPAPFPQPPANGTAFGYGAGSPYGPPARSRAGRNVMIIGAALFAVGLVATVVTFLVAPPGGTFVVAFGPMVFGIGLFVRGIITHAASR